MHLVIHEETDGQMMTAREEKRKWRRRKRRRKVQSRGSEPERKEGRVVTSCCPGKQLDGVCYCHLRQEDGEQIKK